MQLLTRRVESGPNEAPDCARNKVVEQLRRLSLTRGGDGTFSASQDEIWQEEWVRTSALGSRARTWKMQPK